MNSTNDNKMNRKKYLTTPIFYANGEPHIGHLLTTTVTDVLARHYRLLFGSQNVFFTTGTDEHGTTVEQSAKKLGYDNLQDYVDMRSNYFKEKFDDVLISYDYFVRTTNKEHEDFVKNFVQKLIDAGDVYKDKYEGVYCYGCEKFLTKSEMTEDGLCPLHRPDQVIKIEEENYFFKLSKYSDKLLKLIENDTLKIYPIGKKNEIVARIQGGLEDQSISRPADKVSWAVGFPDDDKQTVYVWVDALINYLSSLEINKNQDFWQYATHVLGKDISWFHNVIWPAMLLSAGYDVPKSTFVHSFLTVGGDKISKSKGNVIDVPALIDRYGIDATRYLVLAYLPYKDDSDASFGLFDSKYTSDLVNGLGNLVSRINKMGRDVEVLAEVREYQEVISEHENILNSYEEFRLHDVINEISQLVRESNEYLNANEPWKKNDKEKAEILQNVFDKVFDIGVLLKPILVKTSQTICDILSGEMVEPSIILFGRLPKVEGQN